MKTFETKEARQEALNSEYSFIARAIEALDKESDKPHFVGVTVAKMDENYGLTEEDIKELNKVLKSEPISLTDEELEKVHQMVKDAKPDSDAGTESTPETEDGDYFNCGTMTAIGSVVGGATEQVIKGFNIVGLGASVVATATGYYVGKKLGEKYGETTTNKAIAAAAGILLGGGSSRLGRFCHTTYLADKEEVESLIETQATEVDSEIALF